MKKVYTYVLRSYIGPFIATFFITLFILLMQFVWKYIDDLVGKGFELDIIARLLFYASSTFVPLALPLAVLLSSLMAFGNLGERYEIVAMKAAGISIRQVMRPLMIFIAILSITAFLFSNNVMPVANLKMRTLLHNVRKQKPAISIEPGIFYDQIENYTIKINEKANDGKTIKDVMIYDHSKQQGNVNVTIADSGTMQVTKDKRYLIFKLYNGKNYAERIEDREDKYSRPLQITKFREELRRIDLSSFAFEKTNEDIYKDHYQMMNINQLAESQDSLVKKIKERREKFKSRYKDRFRYYNSLDTLKEFREDSVEIRYSLLRKFFPDTSKPQKEKGLTLEEHNKRRRSRKTKDKKKKSSSKEKASTAKRPVEKTPNPEGYNIRKMAQKAREQNYDMDSLIENDSDFPTLLSMDSQLNKNYITTFKPSEQGKIIEYAIDNARNAINRIDYVNKIMSRKQELIARHKIEWHRKFTLSFACIVLFFIGAPLGAIIRRGGFGFPVVVSVLLFVIYHVISITGEKFAREGVIDPWLGMWASTLVLLPAGIILTLKATTDTPITEANTYIRFFKNIRKRLFKKNS